MIISILSLTLWTVGVLAEDKLLLAQAVFRHGARAPVRSFSSTDAEKYFWRGLGQLTDEGVQQAHDLGMALRQRLVETGFLDKRNNPNEISFYSSPVTRCMITASTVGAAMFDPIDGSLPNVVCVQTEPMASNYLTVPQTSKKLLAEMTLALGARTNETHYPEDTMKLLLHQLAKNSTHFKEKGRVDQIEALLVEKPKGLKLPSWYDEDAEKEAKVFRYKALSFYTGTGEYFHEKWVKCRTGFLLYTMMENIKTRASCKTNCSSTKFYAYSTHDLMIKPLLQSLGLFDQALNGSAPPFTATVLLELWKPEEKDTEPYVKVLWKTPGFSFILLTSYVPGCVDDNCPISNFTSCCSNFMTGSPKTECNSTRRSFNGVVFLIGIIFYLRDYLF